MSRGKPDRECQVARRLQTGRTDWKLLRTREASRARAAEKLRLDELLHQTAARRRIKTPEPARLRDVQLQAGHFEKLASHPLDQFVLNGCLNKHHWNLLGELPVPRGRPFESRAEEQSMCRRCVSNPECFRAIGKTRSFKGNARFRLNVSNLSTKWRIVPSRGIQSQQTGRAD